MQDIRHGTALAYRWRRGTPSLNKTRSFRPRSPFLHLAPSFPSTRSKRYELILGKKNKNKTNDYGRSDDDDTIIENIKRVAETPFYHSATESTIDFLKSWPRNAKLRIAIQALDRDEIIGTRLDEKADDQLLLSIDERLTAGTVRPPCPVLSAQSHVSLIRVSATKYIIVDRVSYS